MYGARMKRRTFHVRSAGALDAVLREQLGVSSSEARALVEVGAVYVRGRRCRTPRTHLGPGTAVMVVLEESGSSPLAPRARPEIRVLYEDEHLLALDKPPGIPAQPTAARAGDSLVDLASQYLGRSAGLVHRLDRHTSGVTLFGKEERATRALAEQFRRGEIRKRYVAIAAGDVPMAARVDASLSKDPSRVGRWKVSRGGGGVAAATRFERLGGADDFSIVACFPETGRTHQIRAHLASLGAPIAGDSLYEGPPRAGGLAAERCLLHAQAVAFSHSITGEPLLIESPLPGDLRAFFDRAGAVEPSGPW